MSRFSLLAGFLAVAGLALTAGAAQADIIAEDDISYDDGTIVGQGGGTGWTGNWGGNSSQGNVSGGALVINGGSGVTRVFDTSGLTGGVLTNNVVYFGFTLSSSDTADNTFVRALGHDDNRVGIKDDQFWLQLKDTGGDKGSKLGGTVEDNKTYQLVARLDYSTDGGIDLWGWDIDGTALTEVDPATVSLGVGSGESLVSGLTETELRGNGTFDNLVLATTFDQAAGVAAVPEPASVAIWSLIGLGLAGFGIYRRRAK